MDSKPRQGFNILLSQFRMYCEMETDAEKVAFMDAIFIKQIYNEEPDLKSMPKLSRMAFQSERHALDDSINGYLRQKKLIKPVDIDFLTPYRTPPETNPETPPEEEKGQVQVEEKEEEKEQVKEEEFVFKFSLDDFQIKKIAQFFSQTKRVMQERVCAWINSLENPEEFLQQTNFYMEYKKVAAEKIHSWESYKMEWDKTDWEDKLKKIPKKKSNKLTLSPKDLIIETK